MPTPFFIGLIGIVLSRTPRQLLALVTDAENGLFSRFIFYYLLTGLEWQDVFSAEPDGTASLGIPLKTAERDIRQWCEQGTLLLYRRE